jgi:hypothetical protein
MTRSRFSLIARRKRISAHKERQRGVLPKQLASLRNPIGNKLRAAYYKEKILRLGCPQVPSTAVGSFY